MTKKYMIFILIGLMAIANWSTAKIVKAETLPTNVETASNRNVLVGLKGSYATDVEAAIKLVNKYRLEACTNGYPNPNNPEKKLTLDDYVPIKWSSDLEYIARIRAAEASIYGSHTRPNNHNCFSISAPNGVSSFAEVLAWGGDTIVSSVKMWYSEKSTWVKQENGVTGHYTSMINPTTTHMAMANFQGTGAGEFTNYNWVPGDSSKIPLATAPLPVKKNVMQLVEVPASKLSSLKFNIPTKYTLNKTEQAYLEYTYNKNVTVFYVGDINWTCDSKYLTMSSSGTINPLKIGKYKVNFTYSGSKQGSITKTITISPKSTFIKKVSISKNKAKITFNKASNISGYQIKYSNWYHSKTVNVTRSKSTKEISGLARYNYYSFVIRTYKKVGKKIYYSPWSSSKTIYIK